MKIEVCTNAEWWRVVGPLDFCDDDDAVRSVVADIRNAIEDAGDDTVNAKGQRMLLHGWNGANTFRRKYGGIGTFDQCSETDWEIVVGAYDTAIAKAKRTMSTH